MTEKLQDKFLRNDFYREIFCVFFINYNLLIYLSKKNKYI